MSCKVLQVSAQNMSAVSLTVITVNALSVLETDFCFKHAGGLTFAGEIFSAIFWLPEKFTGNQKIA